MIKKCLDTTYSNAQSENENVAFLYNLPIAIEHRPKMLSNKDRAFKSCFKWLCKKTAKIVLETWQFNALLVSINN